MTKTERTQLGWLVAFWAFGDRYEGPFAGVIRRMFICFIVFTLACFSAGAVLELIHRAGGH